MKFLIVIFSVYFLALNWVPCADADLSHQDVQYEQGECSHDLPKEGKEECTPFCQCQCCHVHITDFPTSSFVPVEPPVSTLLFQNKENLEQEFIAIQFQPPRI